MKKYVAPILAILFSLAYFTILIKPLSVGGSSLPPLGKFLNPFSGFSKNAVHVDAWRSSILEVSDLDNSVDIQVDDKLVPHIKGKNTADLYYAQGYMHAMNRLWQMDFTYRAVAGKVSEVIGAIAINYDATQRLMGHDYAVEQRLKSWQQCKETEPLMAAYVKGVNAYIDQLKAKDYPIEFKLLNYEPSKWTLEKSAYVYIGMCADLAHGDEDIAYTNIRSVLGDSTFHDIFKSYYHKQTPIVPYEGPIQQRDKAQFRPSILDKAVGSIDKPEIVRGIGSNNWAIDGRKSSSGAPMLASDPHLALRLPSIWYENQLACPEFNTYGVSIPGLPSVVIGFNQHVAWAMTNLGHDFRDWYKVDWADNEKNSYFMNGEVENIQLRKQKIKVRNHADTTFHVRYTKLGPIKHNEQGEEYSLHWLLFDEDLNCDLSFFVEINRAKNYDDYYEASKHFLFPPQNLAFASLQGDIAIRVQGRLPIKDGGQGKFVEDMSSVGTQWKGFIPHAELPAQHNPESGFVFSANQHSTSPAYPYYYTGIFEGFRSRRISEVLSNSDKMSVEDMKQLQLDVQNPKAKDLAPIFLGAMNTISMSEAQIEVINHLKNWDYNYDPGSKQTTLFELWYHYVQQLTYDEIIDLSPQMVTLPEDWQLTELIERTPRHHIFDLQSTPETEFAEEIIQYAFDSAWAIYSKANSAEQQWANHKNLTVGHMASIPAFSHDQLQVGGNGNTVNATTSSHGPSWRMVVSLGNKINAFGVYPGGQDGNPGSPFYDNMLPHWVEGKYYELNYRTDWDNEEESDLFELKLKSTK